MQPDTLDTQVSDHFILREFQCRCGKCEPSWPSTYLVRGLEALRVIVDKPVIIDDAIRCLEHNAAVGGVPSSQHVLGKAADIKAAGLTARQLYAVAVHIPEFNGFGVDDHKNYIHVDVRSVPAKWTYNLNGNQSPWHEV